MTFRSTLFIASITCALGGLAHSKLSAQEPALQIEKESTARLIPISLTGYSGDAQDTLKFDLEIQGFSIVAPEVAQFNVTGSNNGAVEGRVMDRVRKATVLAIRYESGTPRSQAHALADDIVLKITDLTGIKQVDVKRIVQKTFDVIIEALIRNEKVELRNFGVFKIKERKARLGRNPRTNQTVHVPPRKVVVFKPGLEMKQRIK